MTSAAVWTGTSWTGDTSNPLGEAGVYARYGSAGLSGGAWVAHSTWPASSAFGLYALSEPLSLGLLALGGLAILRARRRRAV